MFTLLPRLFQWFLTRLLTIKEVTLLCPVCTTRHIEEARVDLGLAYCLACATQLPTPRYKGAMIYAHKTGGAIQLMSPSEHAGYKRHTRRVGQRSALRNVLFAAGRAV